MPERSMTERRFTLLSVAEAQRALYIDFEGVTGKPPVLLGTLRHRGRGAEPIVHQVVIDATFVAAGPEARAFDAAIETAVERATSQDRRIVAWSEHELNLVRSLVSDTMLIARFESRYANARALAQRWTNKLHPDERPAGGRLVDYLAWIGYEVPPGAGRGNVGDTIRALRPTLEGGRPLTANQRQKWARLLQHNRYDCDGMRAVCLRAAQELERDAQAPGLA